MHAKLAAMGRVTLVGSGILWLGLAAAGPATGGQTFVEALRAAGWQVEVLVDGSLQLTPAGESASVPEAPGPQPSATPAPAPGVQAPGWAALREHGWRVETDAEGSTLLFPPSAAPATPPPAPEPSPPKAPDEAVARDEVARDLDALLAERGWRAQREPDGSLLLFPLRRAPSAPVAVEPSPGVVPSVVSESEVRLPIDSWEKARAVAASWVGSVGDATLQVGRVRQIFRVYLVSIVDATAPHALRHQIAIGVEDGRVVVLN